jgi:plasmid stabilization system protein ParE
MDTLFSQAAARLGRFPMLGHAGKISDTREFIPHPSYRLVYEIAENRILILALVHVAREWPPVTT